MSENFYEEIIPKTSSMNQSTANGKNKDSL